MISFFFRVIKKIVIAALLIYSFDTFCSSLDIVIPINIFTIFFVGLFDIPALCCLIIFSLTF